MTKNEALIRSITGPIRGDIRPLVYAVDVTSDLLFVRRIPMDDILVTKDIYPAVGLLMNKNPKAVSRSVERLANRCWEVGDPDVLERVVGRRLKTLRHPSDLLFYLAFYSYLGVSFFEAVEQEPAMLF